MFIAAAASAVETYGGEGGRVAAGMHEQAAALPLTGIELVVLFGIGVALFVVGMLLARLT